MFLTTTAPPQNMQRWITLIAILCVHVAVFWIARPTIPHPGAEAVQTLSIFNATPSTQQKKKIVKPLASSNQNARDKKTQKIVTPEAVELEPQDNKSSTLQDTPTASTHNKLDLDALHHQAMQIERTRVKSDIEKMNDAKRLNLGLEATFDKEINRVELPECRALLLGKHMIERMMIIQDHTKKKFCRSSM